MNTEIIPRSSVIAMIAEVEAAQKEVSDAFALLISAKKRLLVTLGEYHNSLWKGRLYDSVSEDNAKESLAHIQRNAWKSVVTRLQVREIVSVRKREELDRQLNKGKLPILTAENVFAFIRQLHDDMGSLLEDSAREVFDWLRPTSNWRQLKTNEKNRFGISNKVILERGMDNTYDKSMPERVNYYWEKYYIALDNVFHLLDGQGVSKYPGQLVGAIREAGKKGECETPYFRCKWFRNRNLHIEMKRNDLVQKLNQLAGSDKLRN